MATLVLTAVGTAIGGPVGGAIGALIGQGVDSRLFRPAARQGPRLTELAVQTSSYGTQIPKLFGMMRVAGTVIWASDLVEHRATSSSGKGQPSTTSYSYSASFAVLLSARPIVAVKRIWAEGKLLRGAAGDWKATTGFRLHLGDEDQAADPLIASADGAVPGHRGCAYAVFEGLELADYGNRIPSLTFEVMADAGAVTCGSIAAELASEIDASGMAAVDGFAAAGESLGGVLDALATISGAWWGSGGGVLTMRDRPGEVTELVDAGVGAKGPEAMGIRALAAPDSAARTVVVSHYDPARDYQAGVQRASRPGAGHREERVELPAVLAAGAAKGIAAALIARGEAARMRRTVSVGPEGIGVAPGACVALVGEAGVWRVAKASVTGMATVLELVPVSQAPAAAGASSGRVLGAPDQTVGRTLLCVVETPALDEAVLGGPRLTIMACGEGAAWRRAALLYSLDDGASWTPMAATAAPAVIGTAAMLGRASATLVDRRNLLEVTMVRADMDLHDADRAALDRGANLALVGDELLQFSEAVPLGAARWVLRELRRGRRGTEAAIGRHAAGERFALIEADSAQTLALPASAIGRTVRVMATGVGDTAGPAEAVATITGASVLPPSPVQLTATTIDDGGLMIRWVRRSRVGWGWRDGIDVPLGEEAEHYRVTLRGSGGERVVDTEVPVLTLATADRPPGVLEIEVRQRGTLGLSPPATIWIKPQIEGGLEQ